MIIPRKQWPEPLSRLGKLFWGINSHLTFLLSHSRTTTPSFDHFKKLLPELTIFDLACMKYFLPQIIFFDYIDKEDLFQATVQYGEKGYEANQPDTIDKMYESIEMANDENTSVLIFTFEDMKIDNVGAIATSVRRNRRRENTDSNMFFNHPDLSILKLDHSQLILAMMTRLKKFNEAVSAFILEIGVQVEDEFLVDKLENLVTIPRAPEMLDPVEAVVKRRRIAMSGASEVLDSTGMVDLLKKGSFYVDQIVFEDIFTPAKYPNFKKLDIEFYDIHPALVHAINQYKGINIETKLYCHQTEALEAIFDSKHVIISTSTSSGKSLIYQIPILNSILWDLETPTKTKNSTAIFIFPTKALAQDQKKHIQDLINLIPGVDIVVETYDGDTESKSKGFIRQYADIIFTNPDTIHASILPNHEGLSYGEGTGWQNFLRKLKFIVMDEIHVYKGTFGINVSYVMSRLLRVLQHPVQFISCSATVLDPADHFRVICSIPPSEDIVHVSNDGSASCEKRLLVWQPPALMNKKGEYDSNFFPRVNIVLELAKILLQLLGSSKTIKVIVFCPIRKICEILMKEIRVLLKQSDYSNLGIDERDIMAYRGGYSKEDRRQIEQKMFNGEVRGLVATNALELGVDLSDLDVVITCGFPLLKLNMHQQFGRAGRGKHSNGSLAIFVVGAVPLDQYYLKNPNELMDKTTYEDLCVKSLIGAQMHKLIMESHLQCAAFELPLDLQTDSKWFCNYDSDPKIVASFQDSCRRTLNVDNFGKYRTNPKYLPWPAAKVAIRAIELPAYAVVDITNGRNTIIEEVEESRTSFTLYEGGIFLHQGLPYLVKEFNTDDKYAKVQRVNVDWVTQQRDFTDVDPQEIELIRCLQSPMREIPDIPAYFGKIQTTIIVFGFFKVNKKNEIIEAVEVKNPPVTYKSKGFWLDIPKPVIEAISEKSLCVPAGIHAAQHAIMNILPLFIAGASVNPNVRFSSNAGEAELITECKAPEKEFAQRQTKRKRPARLIFYDAKGGEEGSGVAIKTFEHIDKILMATYNRVKDCDCDWGCPKCVTAGFCKEMLLVMSKPAAYIILGSLVGRDLDELKTEVDDGPEPNLPDINVETIIPASSIVKMSKDIEIIDVKRAEKPVKPIKTED